MTGMDPEGALPEPQYAPGWNGSTGSLLTTSRAKITSTISCPEEWDGKPTNVARIISEIMNNRGMTVTS